MSMMLNMSGMYSAASGELTYYGLLLDGTVAGTASLSSNLSYADFDMTITFVNKLSSSSTKYIIANASDSIFWQSNTINASIGGVNYQITSAAPAIDELVKLRFRRVGSTLTTWRDDVQIDNRTTNTTTQNFRYLGRNQASGRSQIQINSLTIGTPADPLQHDWYNTTGTGNTFEDFGTVGGFNFTIGTGFTWVAL